MICGCDRDVCTDKNAPCPNPKTPTTQLASDITASFEMFKRNLSTKDVDPSVYGKHLAEFLVKHYGASEQRKEQQD